VDIRRVSRLSRRLSATSALVVVGTYAAFQIVGEDALFYLGLTGGSSGPAPATGLPSVDLFTVGWAFGVAGAILVALAVGRLVRS